MTEKSPLSEFNFGPDSQELTPFDVATLLQEYADGRRKFNQIDLKNVNLSDAHLPYIQLEESLLQKVDLKNAILAGACLNHIDLSLANLTHTNLIAADLIRAKLAGANLTGAFLSGANLSGANLRKTNLTDCTLAGANLSGVDFSGAILKNANMAGATLRGANLSAVDLNQIDLSELNLEGCILPADHARVSWTALRPGETSQGRDTTTPPDPSQDLTEESRPLDAFDGSYEELIQDLAEATDWGEGIYPADAGPQPADALTPPAPGDDPALTDGSPFGSAAPYDSAPGDAPRGDADFNPFASGDTPGGANHPDPLTEDSGALSDTLGLIPLDDDGTTIFDGPLTGTDTTDLLLPNNGPAADNPIALGAPAEATGPEVAEEAEPAPAEPGPEPESAPSALELDSGTAARQAPPGPLASPADSAPADPKPLSHSPSADEANPPEPRLLTKLQNLRGKANPGSTAEGAMASTERQALRQTHHQEEVIKTIQSALNRRTHYSLRRKLLEIYGKRCVVTDSNILPLLETVLIDGSHADVADHPSNGLVLRKDIKVLYNLYLIAINPQDYTVMLAPSLRRSSYAYLNGRKINLPKQAIYHPDRRYLQAHLNECKWLDYGADVASDGETLAGATEFAKADSDSQGNRGLLTKLALAMGGLVVGSLLTSLLWTQLSPRSTANRPAATDPEQVNQDDTPTLPTVVVKPEDRIGLQLGPLLYPLGGVIYDESAYLSVGQLQQAGVINGLDGADGIQTADGQQFVKASYVSSLGPAVSWDAETRQVSLDCCGDPEIEPINIAVAGQNLAESGLIIEGSSFTPVAALAELNIAQVQVPNEYFVGVDQVFYVKSEGLKAIGLDVSWNADSRTLTIER
jgi:uncharacterized protein YjbI with pentapeptide repeats